MAFPNKMTHRSPKLASLGECPRPGNCPHPTPRPRRIFSSQRFGFNEIVDSMKYGVDAELDADNCRDVDIPRAKRVSANGASSYLEKPSPEPDKLVLKGISWSASRPLAIINNQSF